MAKQEFICNWGNSLKSLLSAKKDGKLRIAIDDATGTLSGKCYVSNEEGKNEYINDIDFGIQDILEVKKGEFQGADALIIVTRLQTLYGQKKSMRIFPGLRDLDKALDILNGLVASMGGASEAPKKASAASAPTPIPAKPAPAPAPAPAAKPAPAPAAAAPSPAPAAPAPAPVPVAQAAPAPAPAPVPIATPAPAPAAPTPVPVSPAPVVPASAPAPAPKKTESYEQKLKKLDVMHESGLCTDEEYNEKKLKLICEEKGMGAFYDKIQRIFVMKNSGVISDAEFEDNKVKIVDECFDPNVDDLVQFKDNTSKLPVILMSELISEKEFDMKKERLLESVAYNPVDSDAVFTLKLKKLPILVEAELVDAEEFESDKKELKELLAPSVTDSVESLDMKLSRWPAMVEAGTASPSEFDAQKAKMVSGVMSLPAGDESSFMNKVTRLIQLKDKGWLGDEMDYRDKKVAILKDVEDIQDFVQRTRLQMVARDCGLITADEFEKKKQTLIKGILAPNESMEQFQKNVDMLKKLKEGGIISDEEFNGFKSKLMSDL